MHELIQIGGGDRTIIRNRDGYYLLPLNRGFNGTKCESHPEEGLWGIVSSPSTNLGRDVYLGTVLLKLPSMDEETHTVLVGQDAGAIVDLGMVIMRYDVVT